MNSRIWTIRNGSSWHIIWIWRNIVLVALMSGRIMAVVLAVRFLCLFRIISRYGRAQAGSYGIMQRIKVWYHHAQTPLLPPPLVKTFPCAPFCFHIQVHDHKGWNLLCYCVMAVGKIGLKILQIFRHHCSHIWVPPDPVCAPPKFNACKPTVHPMVKSPQHPAKSRGHGPCFWSKHDNFLNQCI